MDAIEFLTAMKGKDVEFLPKIEDYEWYAEGGMRATIVGFVVQDDDPTDTVIKVQVSFAKFDDYNRRFESANYYDKNGNPCLNAREANMYHVEDWCYMGNDAANLMKPLDEGTANLVALFAIDKEKQPHITYVQWLETLALAAMPHLRNGG